jgi:hypothetical protein
LTRSDWIPKGIGKGYESGSCIGSAQQKQLAICIVLKKWTLGVLEIILEYGTTDPIHYSPGSKFYNPNQTWRPGKSKGLVR